MIATAQLVKIGEMHAHGYVTLREIAAVWGEPYDNVKSMRARGVIPGAIQSGNMWFVPTTMPRPKRRISGPVPSVTRMPPPVAPAVSPTYWHHWGVFGEPKGRRWLGWLGGWTGPGILESAPNACGSPVIHD